jgi:hypothetical protein
MSESGFPVRFFEARANWPCSRLTVHLPCTAYNSPVARLSCAAAPGTSHSPHLCGVKNCWSSSSALAKTHRPNGSYANAKTSRNVSDGHKIVSVGVGQQLADFRALLCGQHSRAGSFGRRGFFHFSATLYDEIRTATVAVARIRRGLPTTGANPHDRAATTSRALERLWFCRCSSKRYGYASIGHLRAPTPVRP